MREQLKNGATVIARANGFVLANRSDSICPWVTWRVDENDNAFWGNYYADYLAAVSDFVRRAL